MKEGEYCTLLPLRHDALDEYIALQQFSGNDEGAIVQEVLLGEETGEHAPRAVMDDDSCADEALFAHSLHAERGAAGMPEPCIEGLSIGEKHLSVPLEVGYEHHAWGRGGVGIAPTITTGKGTIAGIHLLGNGITQTNIIHIGHERSREAVGRFAVEDDDKGSGTHLTHSLEGKHHIGPLARYSLIERQTGRLHHIGPLMLPARLLMLAQYQQHATPCHWLVNKHMQVLLLWSEFKLLVIGKVHPCSIEVASIKASLATQHIRRRIAPVGKGVGHHLTVACQLTAAEGRLLPLIPYAHLGQGTLLEGNLLCSEGQGYHQKEQGCTYYKKSVHHHHHFSIHLLAATWGKPCCPGW